MEVLVGKLTPGLRIAECERDRFSDPFIPEQDLVRLSHPGWNTETPER